MNKQSRFHLFVLGAALTTTAVLANTLTEPSMTITEQRSDLDRRIQADVMNVLATNPALSGKVGVESRDQVVNLSGYLSTSGQVWRAGREASKVSGVRYVVNGIRPMVGAVGN